jgi:hypothetical protein
MVRILPLLAQQRTLAAHALGTAKGRYCCKSPRSNKPKNLAKVDLRTTLSLRRFSTPLRRRVIDFALNDMVPHLAACEAHQRLLEFSIATPKRLLQQYRPQAELTDPLMEVGVGANLHRSPLNLPPGSRGGSSTPTLRSKFGRDVAGVDDRLAGVRHPRQRPAFRARCRQRSGT